VKSGEMYEKACMYIAGGETFIAKKKDKEKAEYIRSEDIDDIKAEVIEAAIIEARKEVIKLLGGVISGMNVGQPVIMQANELEYVDESQKSDAGRGEESISCRSSESNDFDLFLSGGYCGEDEFISE